MRAESLAYVPNRDDRGENALAAGLLVFGLAKPLDTEHKTSLEILREAKQLGGHVVARTPYAWDLPVWLASGELDAIELIHHHALRDGVVDNEDDGRPRDKSFFPGRTRQRPLVGSDLLSRAQLRPADSAGRRQRLGHQRQPGRHEPRVRLLRRRVLARARGGKASKRAACSSPTARCCGRLVEGQPPGYVFPLDGRRTADARDRPQSGHARAGRVSADHQERRGRAEVRLAELAKIAKASCRRSTFDDSGWFLVRAVTSNAKNYQFASSGPYYVEQAGQPRVSRASVQFFLDWIDAAEARIRKLPGRRRRRCATNC